jgi:hypothetical protein
MEKITPLLKKIRRHLNQKKQERTLLFFTIKSWKMEE